MNDVNGVYNEASDPHDSSTEGHFQIKGDQYGSMIGDIFRYKGHTSII